MRFASLNSRLAVGQYMKDYERSFTHTADGTLFLDPGGDAVRVSDEEAADLIAAMRATLVEADRATPLAGARAGWTMAGAAAGAVLLGAGAGLPGLGGALALPAAAAVFLLGPVLGAFRIDAAWAHGLARTREAVAGSERVPADQLRAAAPVNRVRPALTAVSYLVAAMLIGLIFAYASMPFYGRVGMDGALARILPLLLLTGVVLVFAARAVDAMTRRHVSEAAIADAWSERQRRPFR